MDCGRRVTVSQTPSQTGPTSFNGKQLSNEDTINTCSETIYIWLLGSYHAPLQVSRERLWQPTVTHYALVLQWPGRGLIYTQVYSIMYTQSYTLCIRPQNPHVLQLRFTKVINLKCIDQYVIYIEDVIGFLYIRGYSKLCGN